MSETILITGASGLLGRALVARFAAAGFQVLAQYHRHPGAPAAGVRWLAGDFSSPRSTTAFLRAQRRSLAQCAHVVHNYGPIAEKATVDVTGTDLLAAFQAQLQPALDITRFLLRAAPLRSVLFVAFEDCGRIRPFKKILGYAMAKNALLLLGRSLAAVHPQVRFSVFSPPSLAGAALLPPAARPVAPARVAERIFRIMRRCRSGCHYRFQATAGKNPPRRNTHG
ncbi:MAG: SDR family oxidoreductase [Acidobacteria bacterium]|nr:SDR family oxidoreductase [Acidobacteriota bacterium]